MPRTLRQIIDGQRPPSELDVRAYGTPEGVEKAWDTRGRKSVQEGCLGPNCKDLKEVTDPKKIPHIDTLEMELSSERGGENLNFTKEAVKGGAAEDDKSTVGRERRRFDSHIC
jgi:hypothetical protein